MSAGFVYALRSDTCPFVKIGRSNALPYRRIAELNRDVGYGQFAPWKIVTYLEVENCIEAETFLHRAVRASHVTDLKPCNELFDVPPAKALDLFNTLPSAQIRCYDKVARMQTDAALMDLLKEIFQNTGLNNFLEHQGVWTLSMFPSTSGGRYFTLNIDRHEVAFATLPRNGNPSLFRFVLDPLICEYDGTLDWLSARNGGVFDEGYKSGLDGQCVVEFDGRLADAGDFQQLPGVRRALIAYWYD